MTREFLVEQLLPLWGCPRASLSFRVDRCRWQLSGGSPTVRWGDPRLAQWSSHRPPWWRSLSISFAFVAKRTLDSIIVLSSLHWDSTRKAAKKQPRMLAFCSHRVFIKLGALSMPRGAFGRHFRRTPKGSRNVPLMLKGSRLRF